MSARSMFRGSLIAGAVLLGGVTVGAGVGPVTTGAEAATDPSPLAGEDAWVAYQTLRHGHEGVWLVHPDGTDDHEVDFGLPDPVWVHLPDWSPDGRRLVVASRGGESEPLYEHDLASGVTRQVFDCEWPCLGDDEPAYSPDGETLAFVRYLGPFTEDWMPSDCSLWLGDVDTGEVRQITSNTVNCDREYGPRWSPDADQLTYHRDLVRPDGSITSAVFVIDADGTDERRLTAPDLVGGNPDWSPDGEWIVFSTYPPIVVGWHRDADLWRIRPDGTDLQRLTRFRGVLGATQPTYTPDGEWIVFTADRPGRRMLWAIPADGGKRIVIADRERIHTHGRWQPEVDR